MFRADLIDALDSAVDQASMFNAIVRAAEEINLRNFGYLRRVGPDSHLIYSTISPRWSARYLSARYDRISPIVAKLRRERLPFHWNAADHAGDPNPIQSKMFDEAAEFGMTHGIVVPIRHDAIHVSSMSFSSNDNPATFRRHADRQVHLIHLLALHLDARLAVMLPETDKQKRALSPREVECLQWATHGKSTYEIARIISIGRRTVVFHIENAKKKFGVSTLRQAIVEGLKRGLIAG